MNLWRVDLECARESLAGSLLALYRQNDANSSLPEYRDRNSVAIIVDGSRWLEPMRLITSPDPCDARWVIIIDTPGVASALPLVSHILGVADLLLVDAGIERIATSLAPILGREFAFVVVDLDGRAISMVRDPIGSRPLYWRRDKSIVSFASSRDRLIAVGSSPKINESAVALTLASSVCEVWSREELLVGFNRVPHGGYTVVSCEGARTGQWWRPQLSEGDRLLKDGVETAKEVRALLDQAVASRLDRHGLVGAHISGGIDSTGIATIGARRLALQSRKMLAAYAWAPAVSETFPDMGWRDERRRIDAFAANEGVSIRFGGASAESFVSFLQRPIEVEGTADLADEMPILRMAQADGVVIMLSGWGGDEVFSSHGYGYLSHLLATFQWERAARWIRAQLRTLRKIGPLAAILWWQGVHPMLPNALYHLFDPHKITDPTHTLISHALLRKHRDQVKEVRHAFRPRSNPNETMYNHFMVGHITHRIETWDVWARQHGFSYTYPLTDWRLVEKLLSLPPELHFPHETPRGLAIDALADALPPGVAKFDAANEASRTAVRAKAWKILASLERDGRFKHDCPWIDMKRFRERLANPADQTATSNVVAFSDLMSAVRVWHMWTRQEGLAASC